MDLARMRAGDYPALSGAWQVSAGPGDLRYGVQARRYEYMNAQCRYCGSGCPGPANGVAAHPRALCLACGTPQCDKQHACLVCMAGFVARPPFSVRAEGGTCGYARCDGPAVAKAARVGQVCAGCLGRPKSRGMTLAAEIANHLRLRDLGGLPWQKIAWFGPPKRYYVRRWHDDSRHGWTGPIDTAGQADREASCWTDPKMTDGGWHAERVEATPETCALVQDWEGLAAGRARAARAR